MMSMNDPVREQIIKLLQGGQAHLTLDDVLKKDDAIRRSYLGY